MSPPFSHREGIGGLDCFVARGMLELIGDLMRVKR